MDLLDRGDFLWRFTMLFGFAWNEDRAICFNLSSDFYLLSTTELWVFDKDGCIMFHYTYSWGDF